MKVENSKMVAVNYTLTVDGQVADKNPEGKPLEFVCGAGMLLPKFEGALMGKEPGDKVSFTLEPADGYGEIIAEAIVELPKNIFMIDGKIAEEILFEGNIVPMSDAEGHRMNGIIREVKEETGLSVSPENGRIILSYQGWDWFTDVWLFRQDFPLDAVVLQPGETAEADKTIDAGGNMLMPGFIDIHMHEDPVLEDGTIYCDEAYATQNTMLRMGVTTAIAGVGGTGLGGLIGAIIGMKAHFKVIRDTDKVLKNISELMQQKE